MPYPDFTPNNWVPGVGGTEVTAARLNNPESALKALLDYLKASLVISAVRPVSPQLGMVWLQSGSTPDTQNPTAPVLAPLTVTASSVTLSWSGSTDNVSVQSYEVWRQISGTWTKINPDPVVPTTYTETGLTANTLYGPYKVIAVDPSGNHSGDSNTRSATTSVAGDTQAPTTPTNVTVTAGDTVVTVAWTGSTDVGGTGVQGYHVWTNGANPITAASSPLLITGLTNNTLYNFSVSAFDAIPNESPKSSPAVPGTPKAAADVTKPTIPTNLVATPGNTLVNLSWTGSTDVGGSGVDHYNIYTNGSFSLQTTNTSYQVTGVANGSLYTFEVSAVDVAGNESNKSTAATATPFGTSGVLFTDDFARANVVSSSVSNTAIGNGWINAGGSWAINNNTLIVNSAATTAMLGNSNVLNTDNFFVEAVYMGNAPLGSEIHLLGRSDANLSQFLGARFAFPSAGGNSTVILERLVTGGSLTTIGSSVTLGAALTVGDRIRFEGDGQALTVKVNGAVVLTGTSSLVTTGKVFGLRARTAQNLALTSFKAGDL